MAIIAALMTAPITILADILIMKILAAPTLPTTVGVANGTTENPDLLDVARSSSIVARQRTSVGSRGRGGSSVSRGSITNFFSEDMDELGSTMNEDLSHFIASMQNYRQMELAQTFQRREFDAMWGLNDAGHFRSDTDEVSMLGRLLGRATDVHSRVVADMTEVRRSSAKEIRYLSAPNISAKERGVRLMRLFQQDLLPGLSGKVLEATGKQTGICQPAAVPAWQKYMAWCLVLGMDATMLFYVYLFAMGQNAEQQDAWLKSFIVWVVMDSVLVATAWSTSTTSPSL